MIGSATSRTSRPGQRPEPVDEDPRLVERRDDRQPERLAELEVLGAAARRDVDDAGPLVLADLAPGDDPMLVRVVRVVARARGEGRPHGRQLVERALVAPPDEVAAGPLLEDLERARRAPSSASPWPARTRRRPAGPGRSAGPARPPRRRSRSASRASSSRPAAPRPGRSTQREAGRSGPGSSRSR